MDFDVQTRILIRGRSQCSPGARVCLEWCAPGFIRSSTRLNDGGLTLRSTSPSERPIGSTFWMQGTSDSVLQPDIDPSGGKGNDLGQDQVDVLRGGWK